MWRDGGWFKRSNRCRGDLLIGMTVTMRRSGHRCRSGRCSGFRPAHDSGDGHHHNDLIGEGVITLERRAQGAGHKERTKEG